MTGAGPDYHARGGGPRCDWERALASAEPVVYAALVRKDLVIAPSILAADLGKLAAEVQEVERAGAGFIHIDVMDGRFAPNITVGPFVVSAVRRATSLPLDVHLMILEPERHLEAFVEAGADIIGVHVEAATHLQRTLAEIRRLGRRAEVVLNPHTPEEAVRYVLGDVDQVLVMSVNPGYGGQKFLPSVLGKLSALRTWIDREGLDIRLEVDGGIGPTTVESVVRAGADTLVAGVAVFGAPDRAKAMAEIREAAGRARLAST